MLAEKGDRALNLTINIILIVIGIVFLYPLWYVLICSFSTPDYITAGEVFLWIKGFTLDGYKEMINYTELWTGYANTIEYATIASTLGLAMQLCAAFVMAQKSLPGRKFLTWFFLITMYFYGGMIPYYLLMDALHLVNTRTMMCIAGVFNVWYMIVARSFFQSSIPDSLFDAAKIDGCGYFRFFIQVVLPLSGAMIAIIALYNVQIHWNTYLTGVIYLRNSKDWTLQQMIQRIQGAATELVNEIPTDADAQYMAELRRRADLLRYTSVIVAAIPMIAIYPFVQKFFVKGVMVGSVKG